MAIIQSILTICALILMVSVTSAEDTIVPGKRFFLWCSYSYKCPANSYRIPHLWCYDGFDDCACNHGFYKSKWEAKCLPFKQPTPAPVKPSVRAPVKPVATGNCNYTCPRNSYRKPNRKCYSSFGDCECNKGFKKTSHACIKKY